ncbi:sulfite oxidase heme-binding subunit YedZ [Amaricoccus tamworthensis]|uniref:sulfite oxidase heme-binding subunit YedZ n=1 Tax=Amaricoccus tamworthensis TaxID=57002 RepID=UPI003C7C39AC
MARISPYWIWFLLALPAFGMAWDLVRSSNPRIFHILVHPSGEFSARFLIIALMATPLCMLLKGWRGPRWLMRNRRYFGVAAFAYAALHTIFYLVDKGTAATVIGELPRFYIWTGWLAFAVFIPLAATSMDYFVRVMGPNWKKLQRWTYGAAVLTLLHWASIHGWKHPAAALIHFGPLALLEGYRIWYRYLRPRQSAV